MAVSTIMLNNESFYLGSISGSSREQAIQNAWEGISVTGKTIIGTFSNSGAWMFLAYKYADNQNGMMLAMPYNSNYVFSLSVMGGTKTVRVLALI